MKSLSLHSYLFSVLLLWLLSTGLNAQVLPSQLQKAPNDEPHLMLSDARIYGHVLKSKVDRQTIRVAQTGIGTQANLYSPVRWTNGNLVVATTGSITSLPQGVVISVLSDNLVEVAIGGIYNVPVHGLTLNATYYATDTPNVLSTTKDADFEAPIFTVTSTTQIRVIPYYYISSVADKFLASGTYNNSQLSLSVNGASPVNIDINVPDPTNSDTSTGLESVISNIYTAIGANDENVTFGSYDNSTLTLDRAIGADIVTQINVPDPTNSNANTAIETVLSNLHNTLPDSTLFATKYYVDTELEGAGGGNSIYTANDTIKTTRSILLQGVDLRFADVSSPTNYYMRFSNAFDVMFLRPVTFSSGATLNTATATNFTVNSTLTTTGNILLRVNASETAFFEDSRATKKGIEYSGDYSAGFTTRSLVDKGYVDNAVAGAGGGGGTTETVSEGYGIKVVNAGSDYNIEVDTTQIVTIDDFATAIENIVQGDCYRTSDSDIEILLAAGEKCITVDNAQTLTASRTIPKGTTIRFKGAGKIIVPTGMTLTVNGYIESEPDRENFEIVGSIAGNPSNTTFYAEWFGAVRDSVTSDVAAIQQTLDAIQAFGGGTLELLQGTYFIDESMVVHSYTTVKGQGMQVTHIQAPADTSDAVFRDHVNAVAQGTSVKLLVAFSMGADDESGHNITFHDFHINMNDHLIGYGQTWQNDNTNIRVTRGIDRDFPVDDVTHNLENIEVYGMWIENVQIAIGGGNRTANHVTPSIFNKNVRIHGNLIDGTSNKGIEFQETSHYWVYNNRLIRTQSCIQCFASGENVFIYDNDCEFTNGGIYVSLGSKNTQVHNNKVKYTGQGLAFGRWEVGNAAYPIGIMYKNDNATFYGAWAGEAETRNSIIANNWVDLRGFTTNANAKCFSFRSNSNAATYSGDNFKNLYFNNNVFLGGKVSLDAVSNNGLSSALTVRNIHFNDNDMTAITMEATSRHVYADSIYVNGGILRQATTLSENTAWQFNGVHLLGGLTLDASSSNKYIHACIGTVTDNGTNTVLAVGAGGSGTTETVSEGFGIDVVNVGTDYAVAADTSLMSTKWYVDDAISEAGIGGAVKTFYNANDTISELRTIYIDNLQGVLFRETNTSTNNFKIGPNTITSNMDFNQKRDFTIELTGTNVATLSDSRSTTAGFEYLADYSAGFNNRSLVDKEYVDDAVAGVSGGGTPDDLGDHTLTENLKLNSFRVTNDGGTNDGFLIGDDGNVSVGGAGVLTTEELNVKGTVQVKAIGAADNTFFLAVNSGGSNVAMMKEGSTNGSGGLQFEGARISGGAPSVHFIGAASGTARGMDFQVVGGTALPSVSTVYPEYTSTGNMFNFIKRTGTASNSNVFTIDNSGSALFGFTSLNTKAATSALVEVQSTTKGFLPPRMTTTQRNAISSPAAGLVVYNTTTASLEYYNGTRWINEIYNESISVFGANEVVADTISNDYYAVSSTLAGKTITEWSIVGVGGTTGTYDVDLLKNGSSVASVTGHGATPQKATISVAIAEYDIITVEVSNISGGADRTGLEVNLIVK